MTSKELKAAGWTRTRLTTPTEGLPRTIWTRGEFHIITWATEPRTWEFRIHRGNSVLIANSTWGVSLGSYMERMGRRIAVQSVDGRAVMTYLGMYGELPKGAVAFGQWATTAIS